MKSQKLIQKIEGLQREYKNLRKELLNHNILASKDNRYLKSDKEDFLILWVKISSVFQELQTLISRNNYRKYFIFIDYDKFVLKKYILVFYFNTIIDLESIFGEHETFIRNYLSDNLRGDFEYFSKYIYKPRFVTLINTPNVFLRALRPKISKHVYKLLTSGKIKTHNEHRLSADYNNLFFYFKYRYDKVMYVVIKNVGSVIARTKFSRRKKGYITEDNLKKYLKIAKPGDIFLTRGNWNASNIGIPGFWKHMSMYIGTGKYLKTNYPGEYTNDVSDSLHYIIEATGEGIKIGELDQIIKKNDYLGVSRTTFNQEKIVRAIRNSFKYIGSQYDFIFNFYSDKSLVCSELIMKSYAKENEDDTGIDIHLEHVGSGLVFPPNNFIDLLISEQKKKKPTVKPLFFIDSREKNANNFIATTDDLLTSGKRARLTLFLKE